LRIVAKLGGALLTDWEQLREIVSQLIAVRQHGHELILVHGGGKQIKQFLEQLKIPSLFHNGLRVTDAVTMDVVQMVLAGLVNKQMVGAFAAQGQAAVGLCGGDGNSFIARKFQDPANPDFDYGFVGEIHEGDPRLVDSLVQSGFIPVIACLGMDRSGHYYNVNADEMASAAAVFCRAERLLFLTDVPGIYDAEKKVIPQLICQEIAELRSTGVIAEGMLPKTRACERALNHGLQQINILGGREPRGVIRLLLEGKKVGTCIIQS
jgi:acetylglutamate kinase